MNATTLVCPGCASPVDPPPGRTQFFCQYCGSTVVVESPATAAETSTEASEVAPLRPAPDLSRFDIDKDGDRLSIRWRWRTWAVLILAPFTLFWNVFILFWMAMAASAEPSFTLFGVPFVVVGIGMIYLTAAMIVNATTLSVRDGVLRIIHGPLPWRSPAPIVTEDIRQLYVKETVHHSKNNTNVNYELRLLKTSGEDTKLITDPSEKIPRALERMLEVHLGIADHPVRGEH